MDRSARLFLCVTCRRQRLICSRCDRGQRFCGKVCAEQARTASLRAAGQRYQASRPGRFSHAARQRRYRARCKKVTHHGSAAITVTVSSPPVLPAATAQVVLPISLPSTRPMALLIRCHVCGQACSPFIRRRWLRYSRRMGRRWRDRHP